MEGPAPACGLWVDRGEARVEHRRVGVATIERRLESATLSLMARRNNALLLQLGIEGGERNAWPRACGLRVDRDQAGVENRGVGLPAIERGLKRAAVLDGKAERGLPVAVETVLDLRRASRERRRVEPPPQSSELSVEERVHVRAGRDRPGDVAGEGRCAALDPELLLGAHLSELVRARHAQREGGISLERSEVEPCVGTGPELEAEHNANDGSGGESYDDRARAEEARGSTYGRWSRASSRSIHG